MLSSHQFPHLYDDLCVTTCDETDQCAPRGWGEDLQLELLENIRICEVKTELYSKGDNVFRLCQGEALKLFLFDNSVRKNAWAKSSILTL